MQNERKKKKKKKKQTQLQFMGQWKKEMKKSRGITSLSRYRSRHKNLMLSSGSGCSVEEY